MRRGRARTIDEVVARDAALVADGDHRATIRAEDDVAQAYGVVLGGQNEVAK